MANGLYFKAKENFLDATVDWSAQDIKVVLVDTASYTVSLSTHDFLDDIAAAARKHTSVNLSSKTSTNGVADAADITLTAVSTTAGQCEALVIYRDSGVAATSELIAYIDTATGLPVTANGGDITIQWNASGIFAL